MSKYCFPHLPPKNRLLYFNLPSFVSTDIFPTIIIMGVTTDPCHKVLEETGLEFELSTLFLVETAQGSWYR